MIYCCIVLLIDNLIWRKIIMGNQINGKEKALVPVATRFEEFNGEPVRIGIVAIAGEKIPVISLSDIPPAQTHSSPRFL